MVNSTVTTDIHSTNKNIIAKLRKAQADFTEAGAVSYTHLTLPTKA